jgi:hypothetical protein
LHGSGAPWRARRFEPPPPVQLSSSDSFFAEIVAEVASGLSLHSSDELEQALRPLYPR